MRRIRLIFGIGLLIASVVAAEPPVIENARIVSRTVDGDLLRTIDRWAQSVEEPAWLGWRVPRGQRRQRICCWDLQDHRGRRAVCRLGGSSTDLVFTSEEEERWSPGERSLLIFLQSDDGRIAEMRLLSEGCDLDAGGLEILWLEGVQTDESVTALGGMIGTQVLVWREALMAIALHAGPAAATNLTEAARQHGDPEVRGEALFWLAEVRIPGGAEVIWRALDEDPDLEVRRKAVFALSLLPDGRGLPHLLEVLRDRTRPSELRQEAFFWYVQSGDDQALELIAEILGR